MTVTLRRARSPEEIVETRRLFQSYADWLARDFGISLDFQDIDTELATLPGKYAPPGGEIFLALRSDGVACGCIALRPFEGQSCEVKRLYVAPEARGAHLGQRLVAAVLDAGRAAGYTRALLDTASGMEAAQRLYEAAGFRDIAPYYHNPVPGVRYMGVDL